MGLKKLFVVICVVVVLVALVYAKKSAQQKKQAIHAPQQISDFELIKELPVNFIKKITVYTGNNPDNKLVLVKDSQGIWVLQNKFGVKAQKNKVDVFLNSLDHLKGEVRAESKELFSDFQIEDSQSLHIVVELNGGKVLTHLLVSFLRGEWNKNFVRLSDAQKIALVNKDFLLQFNLLNKDAVLESSAFADYKLFAFGPKDVKGIELVSQAGTVDIKRISASDNTGSFLWAIDEAKVKPEDIDQSKIETLLQNILNIYATDAFDPSQSNYGFDSARLKLTLTDTKDAHPAQMEVGNYLEQDKAFYVRLLPELSVFKVSEYYIQNMEKDKTYFLKTQEALPQSQEIKQVVPQAAPVNQPKARRGRKFSK